MSWSELRTQVTEAVAGFDPDRVSVTDAVAMLAEVTAMVNLLAVAQARAAARVAGSDRWRVAGARTPAQDLARRCGLTVGAARRVLAMGEHLAAQPEVLAAALGGDLSPTQVELVTDAAAADPHAAPQLIWRARQTTVAGLREDCLNAKAAADPDPEATARRIRADRGWRSWTDPDGTARTATCGPVEDLAWIRSVLEPERRALFDAARRAGQRPSDERLDYDALISLLRRGAGETQSTAPRGRRRWWSRATVIVRVDALTAGRGHAKPGELCEIAGAGPIPPSTARSMLTDGAGLAVVETTPERGVHTVAHVHPRRAARVDITDPAALRAELDRAGRGVSDVVHSGRRPTAHQLTALRWTNPTCTVDGCPNARCDIDHATGWARTRTTRLGDLDPLCRHHHNLKTRANWALTSEPGPRRLVPPNDPRHPRHTRAG